VPLPLLLPPPPLPLLPPPPPPHWHLTALLFILNI
jgi:hypothetical protein